MKSQSCKEVTDLNNLDLNETNEPTDIKRVDLDSLMGCLNPDTAGLDELEAIADGEVCGQCGESDELRLTGDGFFCEHCINTEIERREDEKITFREAWEIGSPDNYKTSNDYYRRLM